VQRRRTPRPGQNYDASGQTVAKWPVRWFIRKAMLGSSEWCSSVASATSSPLIAATASDSAEFPKCVDDQIVEFAERLAQQDGHTPRLLQANAARISSRHDGQRKRANP